MKKILLSSFLILTSFVLSAQLPVGNVWVTKSGWPSELGYFLIPLHQATLYIDTLLLGDMVLVDSLVIAGREQLNIYDAATGEKLDSLPNAHANQMDNWNQNLVVSRTEAPYLTVFSLFTMGEFYSLDTTLVSSPCADLLVQNDRAYLLMDTFVLVVDLLGQDTIGRIETEFPFPFGGMNRYLVPGPEGIFVDVEYATGAIRSSMLLIDPNTMTSEILYHLEGGGNLMPPLLVDDKLYIMNYPAYYDWQNDSLYTFPWSGQMKAAIDHDPASNYLFVYDFHQSTIHAEHFVTGDSVFNFSLNTYLGQALFYPTTNLSVNSDEPINNRVGIYPNPSDGNLWVSLPKNLIGELEIEVFSQSGQQVLSTKIDVFDNITTQMVKLNSLDCGVYFIKIRSDETFFCEKLIVSK